MLAVFPQFSDFFELYIPAQFDDPCILFQNLFPLVFPG
jgi:hypothetical protein